MTDSNSDKERGEKRGVLSSGRAQKLDKVDTDAAADADEDEDDEEEDEDA